ncbi:MAG: redoxin domain-containing protein [Bacteroidetes bacterium]|nr:redoxin domain-containing protein [Bacteroidota bacterium]
MKNYRLTIVIIALFAAFNTLSCNTIDKSKEIDFNSDIPIVDFDFIKPLFEKENDTTYLINFWATWCSPCVKEIPYFEEIAKKYSSEKLKIYLINLDFPSHYESRLLPFVKEKNVRSEIIMLNDPNENRWIDAVNPKWTGAIPATIIYNKDKREFHEKEFSFEELDNLVLKFLK